MLTPILRIVVGTNLIQSYKNSLLVCNLLVPSGRVWVTYHVRRIC